MTIHYSDISHAQTEHHIQDIHWEHTTPKNMYCSWVKRILDVTLVLISAPVVLPIVAVLALIIWVKDWGAPFYTQKRVGLKGQQFVIWKLRSMVADADTKLAAHLAANPVAKAEWDLHQKLHHDPRITRFGHLLRKCSLDELPQLWNVLKGDMSLVGPRPMLPEQQILYPGMAYYALRPGITGPWQVSDRNSCAFSTRATFDTGYLTQVSLRTDISLLLKTVKVVLVGTGR